MIIPVVMAGGSGTRLWPLSRQFYPKQFVALDDSGYSLFQSSLLRLEGLDDVAPPVIVCNEEHRFLVAEQLRQIGIQDELILLEPEGRNTAPAVALAALAANTIDPDAELLVLAADHVITEVEVFHAAIKAGVTAVQHGKMVTFGIVPNKPETGYGYIKRGKESGQHSYEVECFVEKPDLATAQSYLGSGDYYWNSGMFMFTPEKYLEELNKFEPEILRVCSSAYQQAESQLGFVNLDATIFSQCPAVSIDYAVMEKTLDAVVISLDAGWSDLGAWGALWEQMEKDQHGNVHKGDVVFHESRNSLVHSSSRLVSLVGMEDAVIVETKDAVLVTSRDRAQDVKEIVNNLRLTSRQEIDHPAEVRRPWGSYESLVDDNGYQVKRIIVKPGQSLSLQMHYHRAEHWTVVQGEAHVTLNEELLVLGPNQSVFIPIEARHRLENRGDDVVIVIEVQCGDYLGEDDIVRFDDVYGRVQ